MRFNVLNFYNFTVFQEAHFEFTPGINAFIGENGTGKTHILKSIYCWAMLHGYMVPNLQTELFNVPNTDDLKTFGAHDGGKAICEVQMNQDAEMRQTRTVFIPAVDMLAHTKGFVATYDEFKIDFDKTYRDIVSLLLSPEKRNQDNLGIDLQELTGGLALDLDEENERFYITTREGRIAAPMMGEGIRKLATLVQLIKNGWIKPGSVLLWDEPEVNLNPILMGNLAKALLTLARAGVQIFLATHSYVFLKELDLQSKRKGVRYFSLENNADGVVPRASDSYDSISPNKIAEEYESLFDRQLTRATGRLRKVANGK